jgi:two-component sensor histidine kinase
MRHPLITTVVFFLFVSNLIAQEITISQKNLIQKVEVLILNEELDSVAVFLKQLDKNDYTSILNKLNNREELTYVEYGSFLKSVTIKQSINYLSVSNFINDFVKEPTNLNKINVNYVNIKWSQVSSLRDEITLESANIEHEKLENYVSKFDDTDEDVLRAKTRITTHPIVMFNIKQDIQGKELCLKSLEVARKLKDIELEVVFLYYLTDFLVQERKLQEFIDISEESLKLEDKLPKHTDFYDGTIEHLIDAYIFKGGNDTRVKNLINELYKDQYSRINTYELYAKFLSKLDESSPHKKVILSKFRVKNIFELTEKFRLLGKDLNQHDFQNLIGNCAKALVVHGFYKEGIRYKDSQIQLVKNIYSKDLSETLANYKTDIAVKEKEVEITFQKEKTKLYGLIASLAGGFLIVSLFVLRKIRKQSKELTDKNALINKSLREKELLVREVHHRVKNNFQIVSSLLELQSKGIEDERALELANEGKNRVKSMALIHQKLYQNESGLVDFDEYIQLLVKELSSLYKSGNEIDTKIVSKNMEFDVDTAIPLGLIINGIITNSYKYAFKNQVENLLSISINKESNGDFRLIMADNGPGLPSGFNVKKAKSLGLRLINRLVKQLHGTLNVYNKDGVRFEITFKDVQARRLVD